MPDPKLEILCGDSSPNYTTKKVQEFLRHYAVHTEGPYAIEVRSLPAKSGPGYDFTIEIFPFEHNSRISAIIPIQGAELGRFTGGVFERDTPRQIGITCGNVQYVVYENPKQTAEEPAAEQPTAQGTGYNLRKAAMDGEP